MGRKRDPNRIRITWDENKNRINQRKHRVSFEEAATVFYDSLARIVDDIEHSAFEQRYQIIGESGSGRLLVVTYMERPGEIRIITADKPLASERRDYEKGS